MNRIAILIFIAFLINSNDNSFCQDHTGQSLKNPISAAYINKKLSNNLPRLVFTAEKVKDIRDKIQKDPLIKHRYYTIRINASNILQSPLLKREKIGRRLLSVSREMLYRINMLGVVYLIEEDELILERINREVLAVCSFSDWNPSHFLDVAEMSMAVAFALDWTHADLPAETIEIAKKSLVDKGINPSWQNSDGREMWWIKAVNNWNQVCHGGMIAASLAIADDYPELASKTIKRSLENIPMALSEYLPDGVYPEGPTYWGYGTSFTVVTSEMLRSAFGKDFGIHNFPGFQESAMFKLMCIAPSGWYYNFADCGDKRGQGGDEILAWFARETGIANYFEEERFLNTPDTARLGRLSGASIAWMSQFDAKTTREISDTWFGHGSNPIAIIRDDSDGRGFYLGAKGGRGELNHGNMDGGSFIFELDGVRWVVDPGVQPYHDLEKTGFDLWGSCQDCDRWKLLTKNNFGHSTITVNNSLHLVNGQTYMIDYKPDLKPWVRFDMTSAFGNMLESAVRKFTRIDDVSLLVEDDVSINEKTKEIIWQLMTTAEVEISSEGAILRQDMKTLFLNNISHKDIVLSVVNLDPPPLELDKRIIGLKRIELRIPVGDINEQDLIEIKMKLSADAIK